MRIYILIILIWFLVACSVKQPAPIEIYSTPIDEFFLGVPPDDFHNLMQDLFGHHW